MGIKGIIINGKKVLTLRTRAMLTQHELALKSRVCEKSIRRIEGKGRISVQVRTARKLAAAFKRQPQDLVA